MREMMKRGYLTAFVLCASVAGYADSLKLPSVFSDHMVLQRDNKIPVWGWAQKGTEVTVKIADKTAKAKADAKGQWKVDLPAMKAGGPFTLEVNGDGNKTFKDVLIGEVWVCSGQSNMDYTINKFKQAENDVKNSANNNIRLIKFPRVVAFEPKDDAETKGWQVCNPETVAGFSMVGYYFGRDIQKDLNVPVGLIHSAYGGTPVEAWTSTEALETLPFMKQRLENASKRGDLEKRIAERNKIIKDNQVNLQKNDKGLAGKWEAEEPKGADWKVLTAPTSLEAALGTPIDGVVWLKKEIDLPASVTEKSEAVLNLGSLDDDDITYVNGKEVGKTNGTASARSYKIAAGLLKPGKNLITVRLYDKGGAGGFRVKNKEQLNLVVDGGKPIVLGGEWKYRFGSDSRELPPVPPDPAGPHQLSVLYNGMISPFLHYGMRGVIWYQGENNAGGNPTQYEDLFKTLIKDWRKQWGIGDFPFLYVQLAAYTTPKGGDGWPIVRDAQTATLELPNTGMAVALDVGEEKDIHPWRKLEVGERLALAAKKVAYGKNVVFEGPMVNKGQIHRGEGSSVVVPWGKSKSLKINANAGNRSNFVLGFEVAGADGVWQPAKGVIKGTDVIVTGDAVKEPVKVRYGWKDWVVVNLYNEADLPAVPFTADVKK